MIKKSTFIVAAAFAALLSTGAARAEVVTVLPADVTVQAENTPPAGFTDWTAYVRNAGSLAFRTGPAAPPLGLGSLELSTPTGADKITVFNYDFVGLPLADVSGLNYSTYRSAGFGSQVAALNLEIDYNGPDVAGGFTTLVFEPVYNTDQEAVASGVWQDWDAYDGGQAIWWSSRPIPGAPNRDTFVTWDAILAANPDAVILGGVGVNQGSGNGGLVTAVDALTVNAVTYDFEPAISPVPGDKNQCKNGGWQIFNVPAFKNQGDCVSYVNNGRR